MKPLDYENRPLFVSDLEREIRTLDARERSPVTLLVVVDREGRWRHLTFDMPRGAGLSLREALFERYLLAMMNNMVVSFAGASLSVYIDMEDEALKAVATRAIAAFDAGATHNRRQGYGVYLNYASRMNKFLGLAKFEIRLLDRSSLEVPDPAKQFMLYQPRDAGRERALLRKSATELSGKRFCSLDVGGNSIKAAVVSDGRVLVLKEFKWYPTGIQWAVEMNGAQLLVIRFMALMTRLIESGGNPVSYKSAMDPAASFSLLDAACDALEARGLSAEGLFDAIVIGFPDIVVNGKIAGGESFKHQGMKTNPEVDYETEFFKTSSLDDLARPFAREGGSVVVLNDGNAASYLTSVEQAFLEESIIGDYGLFANTIGTEMGTGFISRGGTIQHVPLEGFQHVIDLGLTRAAGYPARDLRSTASMNTGIPGTVQKYISQLGLFRMCICAFLAEQPGMVDQFIREGLVEKTGDGMLAAAVEPIDRRGDLTRRLVKLLEAGEEVVERAFLTMGKAMGVLIDEDLKIFPEIPPTRLVSGGIVASDRAFECLLKGLEGHNGAYRLIRLDETAMASPLMKKMTSEERNFTVAIGSSYIGNRMLIEGAEQGEET